MYLGIELYNNQCFLDNADPIFANIVFSKNYSLGLILVKYYVLIYNIHICYNYYLIPIYKE